MHGPHSHVALLRVESWRRNIMRLKHFAVLGIALAVVALSAMPAMANVLTAASAKADCSAYTLTVLARHFTTGPHHPTNSSFTLNCGGTTTTIPGSIAFPAAATTVTKSATAAWPGSPLTTNCTVTGSATLANSGS